MKTKDLIRELNDRPDAQRLESLLHASRSAVNFRRSSFERRLFNPLTGLLDAQHKEQEQ